MDIDKIREYAAAACGEAAGAGAQHADSIVSLSRSVSVEIENNSVRSCEVESDAGYCVRAFHDGGAGFARGRGLEREEILRAGTDAAALARECEADPDFKGLPGRSEADEVGGLYDPAVAGYESARAIELSLECVEIARQADPGIIVKGGVGAVSGFMSIANSNGVSLVERNSFISYYVFCVVRRGDKVGSYYEYTQARRFADLKPSKEIAGAAAEKALKFLDSRRMSSGAFPVVLGPIAAGSLIRSVISAASAEEIQRGRSFMDGKRGHKIAPEFITVTEQPHVPAGLFSAAFDGEGVPHRKTNLIDAGTLTTYLHNSYTAGKAGEEPTGHASRGSYLSSVGIGFTNLAVTPGAETEKQIISSVKDGLYICMGSLSPNPVTGQVSGTVDFGYRIENGEIAYPVENVMIGGDIFELLSSIEAVSSDCRIEPGNATPSLLLGRVQVAGE